MTKLPVLTLMFSSLLLPLAAHAGACDRLPGWQQLKETLTAARKESNGGFNLDMWGTVVSTDGTVCAVAFTGAEYGDQWLGSRVISAQKANTANAFSLPGLALSTANLYSATQPGGSLYGLQHSNPVDTGVAYAGNAAYFGTAKDPMTGKRIGGVNVFGGGLALYNAKGDRVGALGVSGDSSCADHNIAWKTRQAFALDYMPGGVSPAKDDNIIFLGQTEKSSGFKHPLCGGTEEKVKLSVVRKK
ncbi:MULTISPECIES: GlcG/HbpS family heme-binding protein [Hydrocarboniphaga]|nr:MULTISPECIES: heme-binding protein [Hydrocarboniphaga]MDZ4078013.1 heme-binding protein [Hydrocarboniphaga sp.]